MVVSLAETASFFSTADGAMLSTTAGLASVCIWPEGRLLTGNGALFAGSVTPVALVDAAALSAWVGLDWAIAVIAVGV